MKPFIVPDSCVDLKSTILSARELLTAAHGGKEARVTLAQLWITEGIPFAFRECPAVYESIRIWLGHELRVHAKQVGLTGSGRFGESINPQKFGQPFDKKSDLDFYIVSDQLFSAYRCEFFTWCKDYTSGKIIFRNNREKILWKDNKNRVPKNIKLGFIDVNRIPERFRYSTAQKNFEPHVSTDHEIV